MRAYKLRKIAKKVAKDWLNLKDNEPTPYNVDYLNTISLMVEFHKHIEKQDNDTKNPD